MKKFEHMYYNIYIFTIRNEYYLDIYIFIEYNTVHTHIPPHPDGFLKPVDSIYSTMNPPVMLITNLVIKTK